MTSTLILVSTLAISAQAAPAGSPDLAKFIYPLAPPKPCPPIKVDLKDSPEMKEWGEKAKALATEWFPHLCQLLSTQDYVPPKEITFSFRKGQDAPAWASRDEISFSVDWLKRRPDDLGMVIHELTHIVQAYPANKVDTGWLVEGIADYTRWWRYEPEAGRPRINFVTAKHTDAYQTTAYWLAWVSKKYDSRLIPALDLNLRKAEDPNPTFEKFTGKKPEALWEEFKTAVGPKP